MQPEPETHACEYLLIKQFQLPNNITEQLNYLFVCLFVVHFEHEKVTKESKFVKKKKRQT